MPHGSQGAMTPVDPVARAPTTEGERRWRSFVQGFVDGLFERRPDLGVAAGRHEHDGRLPDWSPDGLGELVDWLRSQDRRARRFEDEALPPASALERAHLISEIEARLFWLVEAEWPWRSPSFYLDALDPDVYVARPYAPPEARLRALTAHAGSIPAATARIRDNLRSPLPRAWARLGRESFAGLASFFEGGVQAAFAGASDAARGAFDEASRAASTALRELAGWFEEQEASGGVDFAFGAGRFARMLRATERVDLDLAELQRIGERELDRNLAALREACGRLDPDADAAACVAAVRDRKPEGGIVAEARAQVVRLRSFVEERGLVTIPPHPEVRVEESPPYMRWNNAYIHIPGPYESGVSPTYYLTPPDPGWSAAERRDYLPGRADLLFTTVHEVWPGHFLQFLHAHASPSPLARSFVGYAFAEGWAHYAEEMTWEAGLEREDPEAHVGMVMNALVRTVRFLAAIGLHTGALSVEEAERLFREKALLDPAGARQQAARGTFDPGYLNYTLGKLAIRKLRDDWVAGERETRDFHDRLLALGGPPLPLAREALLGPDAGPLL